MFKIFEFGHSDNNNSSFYSEGSPQLLSTIQEQLLLKGKVGSCSYERAAAFSCSYERAAAAGGSEGRLSILVT